jgi:hypothetical protein
MHLKRFIMKKLKNSFYFYILSLFLLFTLFFFIIHISSDFFECKKCRRKNVTCLNRTNSQYFAHEFNVIKNSNSKAKIHIAYVHFLDTSEHSTVENFRFFMHFAHYPCNSEVDFTIILNMAPSSYAQRSNIYNLDLFKKAFNSEEHLEKFKSCESHNAANPMRNTYLILRENRDGGDLCAFADMIAHEKFWQKSKSIYKYFFFINSSARGPFLPNYWLRKWYEILLVKLNSNWIPLLNLKCRA